jgi:glycosyltransferase involved in cell wall biosynthesis
MSISPILVSVVVPTYRRPDLLARCLKALCAQSLEHSRYEVIVADDDGGDEKVRALVEQMTGALSIRYVPVSRTQGPAGARNAGWRLARGDIIAFTDDDTIPDPHWLAEGSAALARRPQAAAAAGRIEVPMPARPTDYERDTSGLARAEFATANTFVRRSALERVGGFDERFTRAWREDSDLMFALMQQAGPVTGAPLAIVVHPVRPAPWGVSIGQQAKVYFDALLYKKYRRLYRSRIRPMPPWHYYIAVLALLAIPVALLAGWPALATLAAAIWAGITAVFCWRRLRGASTAPSHVAEMIVTSIVIPPVSLYWRLRGALDFRVLFL